MSELQKIRIDGEIDEITTQSFQNHDEAYESMKFSTALMPTTMIDHTMK